MPIQKTNQQYKYFPNSGISVFIPTGIEPIKRESCFYDESQEYLFKGKLTFKTKQIKT